MRAIPFEKFLFVYARAFLYMWIYTCVWKPEVDIMNPKYIKLAEMHSRDALASPHLYFSVGIAGVCFCVHLLVGAGYLTSDT